MTAPHRAGGRRPAPEDAPYVLRRGVRYYGGRVEYRLRDLRRVGTLTRPDRDHPAYGLAEWGNRVFAYAEVALYDVDSDGPVDTGIVAAREVTPADFGVADWSELDAWDGTALWRALGQLCDDPEADDPLLAAELEYALQDGRARVLHYCPS